MTICTQHSYGGPHACPYCELAQLRADLATAEADIGRHMKTIHARDHIIATVTAERDGACEGKGNLWVQLETERAAHAETRKAAEAQIKAVREALSWLPTADELRVDKRIPLTAKQRLADLLDLLTPATSPGDGEGT